ncbi:IclR family transcriptional regulator [Rhodoplanes roseus]|uniref:IclR family transcriptional regulator n=1 Tax=Rhodoplanes roseus TaxID=29409 RepID=UPI0014752D88|nr:IclR family transcriptional regulator [Rhodoplanes roseus]
MSYPSPVRGPGGGRSKEEGGLPSSGDRLLAVLGLFTIERPEWTVEDAAVQLGVSATTAYRYFKRLTRAGLISPVSGASYTLGPAIIQMDRQIQLCDPMLNAARGVMTELIEHASEGGAVLLCRLFHDRVMCVHQEMGRGPQEPIVFQRGRPMPLFRGATSKIILAHLPNRTLKSLFTANAAEIATAGLGQSWEDFRRHLAAFRRAGYAAASGDVDQVRAAVAAPVFGARRAVIGSLSFLVPKPRYDEVLRARLAPLVIASARNIEAAMQADDTEGQASRPRVRVSR